MLGDGFFNRFYTYFNIEKRKIGIANNVEDIKLEDILKKSSDYESKTWKKINKNLNKKSEKNSFWKNPFQFISDLFEGWF